MRGVRARNKITVINYYPLEFFGGGEVFSIGLFNRLNDFYDIEYVSPDNFRGQLRVGPGAIRERVHFRYSRVRFEGNGLPFSRTLFRPIPPFEYLNRTGLTMLFLDRPPPRRLLVRLSEGGRTAVFLLHGLTFERRSIRSIWGSAIAAYQEWVRLYMRLNRGLLSYDGFFYQVLNDSQLRFLSELGIRRSHIFLIPNSVDFTAYRVRRNDDKFRVLYLGRLDKLVKGSSLLIDVGRRLEKFAGRSIEFIIAGSGQSGGRVAALFENSGVVKVLGQVTDEAQKVDLLSSCNLMASFSNTEAFSISLLEGLASGLPVLSTDVSGPAYIINRCQSFGRVLRFSAEEFVGAIGEYYEKWSADPASYFATKLERRKEAEAVFGGMADVGRRYKGAIDVAMGRQTGSL